MKQMTKILCLLLSLLLSCLTFGVSAAAEAASTEDMLLAYADVLRGDRDYLQCDPFENTIGEAYMTDDINLWYGFVFDVPLRFTAYAVTDLDSDGYPEILLRLSEDFGYELLRYADGQVYGYPFFIRAMEAITAEGEIHGANGAGNFGWYRVHFTDAVKETQAVCWQYDDRGDSIVCFIGDTEVAQSEFAAMNDALWDKPMLQFRDYPPEIWDWNGLSE